RGLSGLLAMPAPVRRALAAAVPAGRQPAVREFADAIASGRPNPLHYPLGLSKHHRQLVLGGEAGGGWTRLDGTLPAASGSALETLAFDTQEYEFQLRLPELLLMRID